VRGEGEIKMYKGQNVIVTAISNMDKVALLRAVNGVINTREVLDIQYVALQKEPCVYEYTAFITVKV
jgi:hypothetical protein